MNEQTKEIKERTFILKTYTRKELREIYGVPPKTFQRWLEPFNEAWGMKNKRYLTGENYLSGKTIRCQYRSFSCFAYFP